MNGQIVLKSLAELGQFVDLLAPAGPEAPPPAPTSAPPAETFSAADIEALLVALGDAAAELRALNDADTRVREEAAASLAAYRLSEASGVRLERLIADAEATARQAEALATHAFNEDLRAQAERTRTVALALAATGGERLAAVRTQIADLAARSDVRRLLEEEQRAAEAAQREADDQVRREELRRGLEQAETLVNEGKENEARRLLGELGKAHPDSPETASSLAMLDRRVQVVKSTAAEQALRQARRLARHSAAEAVALLGPLDLEGLPDALVRQVYGCWLAACRRLPLTGARHYSPRFGRGAILVPVDDGRLEVVTAIGLPEWIPGRRFAPAALRGARPL